MKNIMILQLNIEVYLCKEPEWRRSDSGRVINEDSEKRRTEPSRCTTAEETEWRRPSTSEEKSWRRPYREESSWRRSYREESSWRPYREESSWRRSYREESSWRPYREESSSKQEGSWKRVGPLPSDRGERSTKSREDSWRKDTDDSETSPSSPRWPTRILKSEKWRSRAKQTETLEIILSGLLTTSLQEQKLDDQDNQYHDETIPPERDESLARSENNSKTPVSWGRPIESNDDDGFIPVKSKRRGKNQTGHGHDE
ncbi:unnamed protein product [Rhizophagus irregularis]|nr:unnamed protein product [Rhizophagus irregularis]